MLRPLNPSRTGPAPGTKQSPQERHPVNTGFTCPKCELDRTSVKDSRQNEDGTIKRRRVCGTCGHRFATIEVLLNEGTSPTEYNRSKLLRRLVPRLLAIADEIDLLRAEHE